MAYRTKCNLWLLYSYIGGLIGGLHIYSLLSIGRIDNLLPLVVIFAFIFSAPIFVFILVLSNSYFSKIIKHIYIWTFISPFVISIFWFTVDFFLFGTNSDNSLVRTQMVFVCSICGAIIFSLGAVITKNERGV